MDEDEVIYNHSNPAYVLNSREDYTTYEPVVVGSTLTQDNKEAGKEVLVKVSNV